MPPCNFFSFSKTAKHVGTNGLNKLVFSIYSFAPEYGSKPGSGYRNNEEMSLLKTVLQDSINLLEQVG